MSRNPEKGDERYTFKEINTKLLYTFFFSFHYILIHKSPSYFCSGSLLPSFSKNFLVVSDLLYFKRNEQTTKNCLWSLIVRSNNNSDTFQFFFFFLLLLSPCLILLLLLYFFLSLIISGHFWNLAGSIGWSNYFSVQMIYKVKKKKRLFCSCVCM